MNAVKAWSFSRWETYDQCPLKFKGKFIDKWPEPAAPALERGNRIHLGTAAYVNNVSDTPPPEAIATAAGRRIVEEIRAFPATHKLVEQQWGFTSSWKATGWFGGDTWFRSILDVALLYDDLTGEAIDWKSGKYYPANEEQIELFGASFLCRYPPATSVTTRLVYLDSGDEVIREFPRSGLNATLQEWHAKVQPMFNDELFAPRPNDKCYRCAYRKDAGGQCKFG